MVTKGKDKLNLFHEMVHSIRQLIHENIYLGFTSFSMTGLRMSGAQVVEKIAFISCMLFFPFPLVRSYYIPDVCNSDLWVASSDSVGLRRLIHKVDSLVIFKA